MAATLDRTKAMIGVALAVFATAIAIALTTAPTANADSTYCGGWLGGKGTCYGAARWINALYGSGDHHSVCISTTNYTGTTCSSGPGQGTYNPLGADEYGQPWIYNQGWGNNFVHGYVYW